MAGGLGDGKPAWASRSPRRRLASTFSDGSRDRASSGELGGGPAPAGGVLALEGGAPGGGTGAGLKTKNSTTARSPSPAPIPMAAPGALLEPPRAAAETPRRRRPTGAGAGAAAGAGSGFGSREVFRSLNISFAVG